MTDYVYGKFGDCSFSRFGSIVRTDRHTDADERFTPATVVGVNNGAVLNPSNEPFAHLLSPLQLTVAAVFNLIFSVNLYSNSNAGFSIF